LQSAALVGEIVQFAGAGVNSTGAVRVLGNNNVTLTGNVIFTAGAPWFFGVDVATASLTTTGVIDSQGANRALTKVGSGTMIVGGAVANTFAGGVEVVSGPLVVTNPSATPLGTLANSGNVLIDNGATLQLQNVGGPNTIPNPLIFQTGPLGAATPGVVENLAGNNSLTGAITLPPSGQATFLVDVAADTLIAGGIIGGPGGLLKAGPGTLLLNGLNNNNYAGTTTVLDGGLALA
jgi:autotransporter-associated beta strand protein